MPDGSNLILQLPRPGNPELATSPGMAVPTPREAVEALASPTPMAMPDTSGPGPTALQEPPSWAYDFDPATGIARATFNGEVNFTSGGAATAGVTSWNTRTGAVVLTAADIQAAGGAPTVSPIFTGTPLTPTAVPGTATGQIASTQFVAQAIASNPSVASWNGRGGAVSLLLSDVTSVGGAPTVSPALTGLPTVPTASLGTASAQIASTQFVANAIAGGAVASWNGRQGNVTMALSDVTSVGGAPIASPIFTGSPAVPTAAPGTSTGQAASTAFVTNAVAAATSGVSSFNTRTGAVTLLPADVTGAGGAPILSPALTGTPTTPTATAGTSTGQIASTAFVMNAVSGLPGVNSFNGRIGVVTLQLADVTSVGGAPLASPALSGTPTSTTAPVADNSSRIATTAFVLGQASTTTPNMDGTAAIGTLTTYAKGDHTHPSDTSRLALAGGTLTGPLNGTTATFTGAVGGAAISGTTGTFSSNVGIGGTTTSTGNFNGPRLNLTGATVGSRDIVGYVGANPRWDMSLGNGAAETGANIGSDFALAPWSDTGAVLPYGMIMNRANGTVTFYGGNVTAAGTGSPQFAITDQNLAPRAAMFWYQAGSAARFQNTNSNGWLQIDGGGNFIISGQGFKPGGGQWVDSSDERVKRIVGEYAHGLADVLRLRPVKYVFLGNDTPSVELADPRLPDVRADAAPYPASPHYQAAMAGTEFTGLVAQEVEQVFPEMVAEGEAFIDGEAVSDLRTVNSTELVFALVNAVKELAGRVAMLEGGPVA